MIRTILVPVQRTNLSERALAYAAEIGKALHARIHVCYVVDYLSLPGALGTLTKSIETAPEVLREDGDEVMARTRAVARRYGVCVEEHVLRGNVSAAILRLARRLQVDLIVMGTHGRSGLPRLVAGSVAEHVVRHGRAPVMLIRDDAR